MAFYDSGLKSVTCILRADQYRWQIWIMKIITCLFSCQNWQACFQRRNNSDDQWVREGRGLLQLVKHRGTYRIFWSYASCIFPAHKFTGNSIFEVIKIDSNHSFLVVPWLRQSFAWSFTAEACLQSQVSSCVVCGRKPGTGTLTDLGNKTLLVLSSYVSTIFFQLWLLWFQWDVV